MKAHYEQSTISTAGLNCDKPLYKVLGKKKEPEKERERAREAQAASGSEQADVSHPRG